MAADVTTDVLVVGAGPAGASAAVFLGKHGVPNIMISRHRSTAETPRAHITNQRTMEALRDAGLEAICMAHASPSSYIEHSFWLRSMTGEELARTYSWGNDPLRKGDYEAASPCRLCDLPQTQLEPILVSEAARLGSHVRFGMELLSFVQDDDGVTATVRDRMTNETVTIRAKYMIGADGARSRVVEQLGIPLIGQHGLGNAINVLCEVDLSGHVVHRKASLYSTIQPGSSLWAPVGVFRMVRPWDQWLVGLIVPEAAGTPDPSPADIEDRVREIIGKPSIPLKILHTSVWTINDVVASYYAEGRVFCMGDAVHRHPPTNGLGSNTCVQDAFNLAWKIAMVLQGKAAPALLDSYNAERQPVGRQIVARANKSMMQNNKVWDLLGGGTRTAMSQSEHAAIFETREGRATLRREIDIMRYEYHAHGVEMNRNYMSSAIVEDDTPTVAPDRDAELFYQPTARPGASLPHVWLGRREAGPRISTLDVAGKQCFTLITGHGGDAWAEAARAFARRGGVEIAVVSIGPYLDYEDLYGRWAALSGIEEDGCVLIRPDLHVGWRSATLPADPRAALAGVMNQILGWAPAGC